MEPVPCPAPPSEAGPGSPLSLALRACAVGAWAQLELPGLPTDSHAVAAEKTWLLCFLAASAPRRASVCNLFD